MDPAPGLIAELFARRRWLLTGIAVAAFAAASRFVSVGVLPPSITTKQLAHATASTQLYVGPSTSGRGSNIGSLADTALPRAQTLADLASSPELRGMIARSAGVPVGELAVDTPVWTNVERVDQWPSAGKRDSQILAESAPARVTLGLEGAGPVIDVATQAPSTQEAAALAASVGNALNTYVSELQTTTGTRPARRYGVSQLVGIGVSPGGKSGLANVAAFTFAAVLFIWCGATLFLARLATDLRAVRARVKVSPAADRSSF